MSIRQIGAVARRRLRPDWTEINRAQASFLPEQRRIEDDIKYRDKLFNQEQSNFERNYALSREELNNQKKQQRKAEQMGYANLGLTALGGAAQIYSDYDTASAKNALNAAKTVRPALEGATTATKTVATAADAGRATVAADKGGFLSSIANSDTVNAIKKPVSGALDYATQGVSSLYTNAIAPAVSWLFSS